MNGGLCLGLMLRLGDTWEVGEFGVSKGKGGCIVECSSCASCIIYNIM